jgi:hypothetical protein
MRPRFSLRFLLLLIAVAGVVLGWLQYSRLVAELNAEADLVYHGEVQLAVCDATTKEVLHICVYTKGRSPGQRWPRVKTVGTNDMNELRVEWLATGPIRVGVSAEGYEIKGVTLDQSTRGKVVIPLEKEIPGQVSPYLRE